METRKGHNKPLQSSRRSTPQSSCWPD